jgi:phosphoribosylamine--glycine ligase
MPSARGEASPDVKILVVGSGGREHALLWALQKDDPASKFFCAPGNPGTATLATNLPINANDLDGLISSVEELGIGLTVVGPEVPLALGLADRLRERGKLVFGPGAQAARIESSKAWAKEVMHRAGVPTAGSRTFIQLEPALEYVRGHPEPLVVKASGLAAGKGAVVCQTRGDALRAVRAMMEDRALGDAGNELVIEEFMEGEELSVFALTEGQSCVLLPAAQDHKRLEEEDRGPNTGGMGAYSPVSIATPELLARIERTVILPTLAQMEKEASRFNGLLYAGLMIGRSGDARVVEFNCRFGDPETQAILPLLEPGLLNAIERVARSETPGPVGARKNVCAVTTVLAARGYPDHPERGALIEMPDTVAEGVTIFHAGTTLTANGRLAVAGGRVFGVTGTGSSFTEAQQRSRLGAESINYPGRVFRKDIGWREVAR